MIFIRFASAREAASSVKDLLDDKRRRLSLRPFNYYDPANTPWWLIPGPDWPAYRYGKYAFAPDDGMLSCGLYVEKGLGASTMGTYGSKYVMDADWQWQHFIRDIQSGRVAEATAKIRLPLFLTLTSPKSIERFEQGACCKQDKLVFRVTEGRLEKVQECLQAGCLFPLAKLERLEALPEMLSTMKNLDWIWIDLVLGTKLHYPKEGADLSAAVDGQVLVEDLLVHFEPWFR